MSRKCISKREIEEEDKEDDYSDSNSSSDDKGNDADQDEAVENMEIYKMECSKSRENRLWFEMAQVQVIGSHLYFAKVVRSDLLSSWNLTSFLLDLNIQPATEWLKQD